MNRVKDLSGQRFGRLVVLHRDESAPAGRSKWVCRCECGETVSVLRNHLVSGSTKAAIVHEKKSILKILQENDLGDWSR